MKTESIAISYKTIAGTKKTFSLDYESPEDLDEAIELERAEVFKKYSQMRLIKFRDLNRGKKEKAERDALAKALENRDDPQVAAALAALGIG
jgi:hypothetical protein